MPSIVLASGNAGKTREFLKLAENLPASWQLVSQTEYQISDAAETGLSFVENALIKARHAARLTGLPSLGDDSGVLVDALDGAPGLYSARYAGEKATRQDNIQKLLKALEGVPESKRTARFYCVLVYLTHAEDPLPIIAEGYWQGKILTKPQGDHGFGYEPVFYLPAHEKTAAQIPFEEKINISHRGQAWQIFTQKLLARESHTKKA